jgi:ABC-type Fe3+-siderophore transport system permease subunit
MEFRFVFWDVLPCKIIVRLHGSTSQKTNLNLILCSYVVTIIGLFLLPPLFPYVRLVLLGKESARERGRGQRSLFEALGEILRSLSSRTSTRQVIFLFWSDRPPRKSKPIV